MRVTFWWNSPCKSVSGIFRELTEQGLEVAVVCERGLSDERKKLGFVLPDFGAARLEILPTEGWRERVAAILAAQPDAFHFFAGLRGFPKIAHARALAIRSGLPVGIMAEAPFNPERGLRRLAKNQFIRHALPLHVRPFARRSRLVLSLSGDVVEPFEALGWRRQQIFPFGYFTEPSRSPIARTGLAGRPFRLLCTGYLQYHKGIGVLLDALALLRDRGIDAQCTITGHGPEEAALRSQAQRLGLTEQARFVGVLSNDELEAAFASTDLFVAPGLTEPWGIRINDALLRGLPLAVSSGIGASELVAASSAGSVFRSGDAQDLADKIARFATEPQSMQEARARATEVAERIHPRVAARYLHDVLRFDSGAELTRPRAPWLIAAKA